MKYLISALIVLAICACAPTVTIAPAPEGSLGEIRPGTDLLSVWQVAYRGEFRRAERLLAAMSGDSSDEAATARGLLALRRGDNASAEVWLRRAFDSRADTMLRRVAWGGLKAVLTIQRRYAALESVGSRAVADGIASSVDRSDVTQARIIATLEPMRVCASQPKIVRPMARTFVNSLGSTTPAVAVRVNGYRAGDFILDTGTSAVVVSEEVARRCQVRILRDEPLAVYGFGGQGAFDFRLGVVDSLQIGDLTIRSVPVAVTKLDFGVIRLSGLIGWSVFAKLRVTLDYPARSIVLEYPVPEATGQPSNLFFTGLPTVEAFVEGSGPLHFVLDSGSDGSLLTRAGFDKLPSPPALAREGGCVIGLGGSAKDQKPEVIRGASVAIAGQSVRPLSLPLHRRFAEDNPIIVDGLVGGDVLSHFVVTIDAQHGVLSLVPSAR